ncbi:aspartyl protease family protein 2-like [Tasmannia lanceolata]|uniref:aspartyl protease family protein 2-like n=1 Tax=Tasmannia lanceolata TaxID=3420 RepID=UPI004062FAFB
MFFSKIFILVLLLFISVFNTEAVENKNPVRSNDTLNGIEFPSHMAFNSVTSSVDTGCRERSATKLDSSESKEGLGFPNKPPLKLHLKHRPTNPEIEKNKKESLKASNRRDLTRIHTLHKRIKEGKNQNTVSRIAQQTQMQKLVKSTKLIQSTDENSGGEPMITNQLVATLESGVSLGSGEYFMDVYLGTPPKHFSLILDTGSDLNWIQCLPCYDCFEQNGPPYNPLDSSSFKNVLCNDPRCQLVSSPDPPRPCKSSNQTCQYFYWYGDRSNTTGDFSLETFTVNLTTPAGGSELRRVENVMFGCGHWNRGLFHGAAGLLGLGRGSLSFSSQLRSLYGHTFSYCLVDRNSNLSVSSKLIFGEDKSLMNHPNLNFTSLVNGKESAVDTFYYVQIKSIMVGGETLDIPAETWRISPEGTGGTIIDSGTTLSYFADPTYRKIKEAFVKKVKDYPVVTDFPVLEPCYNVSGVEKVELPEFTIVFEDGAVWDFPVENYFIRIDPDEIVCLAMLGTPRSSLSILGNYQQQNFHVVYDTKKSRLGFAPMRCADV